MCSPRHPHAHARARALAIASDGALWLGSNRGEWGGGWRRIDRGTGALRSIEQRDRTLCGGLLNADCHPVNAVARDADHAGCVLAAMGLSHLGMASGRILRTCADGSVTRVFEQLLPRVGDNRVDNFDPMYGVTAHPGAVVYVGAQRVYASDGVAPPQAVTVPWSAESALRVGTVRGVTLVSTAINQRHSVSGASPLVAAVVPE